LIYSFFLLVRGPWPVGKKNSNRPIQSTQKYHLIWTPAVKAQGQYFFTFVFHSVLLSDSVYLYQILKAAFLYWQN
jgi:hypothetical protein